MEFTRCGKRLDLPSLTIDEKDILNLGLLQGMRGLDEYVSS